MTSMSSNLWLLYKAVYFDPPWPTEAVPLPLCILTTRYMYKLSNNGVVVLIAFNTVAFAEGV